MARVRTRNTTPEVMFRRALWARGWRYSLHPRLPGKPDFVFVRERVAVFVDGCFWHSCPQHGTLPRSNRWFWRRKLNVNVSRDRRVDDQLAAIGWHVIRVWEHSVEDSLEATLHNVLAVLFRKRASQGETRYEGARSVRDGA